MKKKKREVSWQSFEVDRVSTRQVLARHTIDYAVFKVLKSLKDIVNLSGTHGGFIKRFFAIYCILTLFNGGAGFLLLYNRERRKRSRRGGGDITESQTV